MSTVKTFQNVYKFAQRLIMENGQIPSNLDCDLKANAADLVTLCQSVDSVDRENLPSVQALIVYADVTDQRDWDLDDINRLAENISDELESSDKRYGYRASKEGPDGDSWEVFGAYLDGSEDWVAYVTTETVAQTLVLVLEKPHLVQEELSNVAQ